MSPNSSLPTLERRLKRLAERSPATAAPDYLSFASEAELQSYLTQPHSGRAVTGYVGLSPDDWDAPTSGAA